MLQKNKYWILSLSWAGLIYSTLYIVRPVCEFLKEHTPFVFLTNAGMGLMLGLLGLFLFKRIKKVSSYGWLLIVLGMYAVSFLIIEHPEEKLHLIEYGVLSFLLFKALAARAKISRPYLFAFVLASLLGWVDEGIQQLLPNRYYQNKDVLLNVFSAAMGLFVTAIFKKM